MKKYIILSVNDNPDYLYFLPLAIMAWSRFGWWPVILFRGNDSKLTDFVFDEYEGFIYDVDDLDGYRSDTITQISRLYASCEISEGYLMTGDIDMLPLSDYWQVNGANEIRVWGHDLTGYTHYPICYIGMTSDNWRKVMKIDSTDYNALIKRDLDQIPNAKSPDFNKFWYVDQQLITDRLKTYKPTVINRGQYPNGYARGRIDRGAWSLDHKEYIDCHMHHQIHHKGNDWKFKQTLEMLHRVWPEDNFDWYIEFHNEFKKLTGHA